MDAREMFAEMRTGRYRGGIENIFSRFPGNFHRESERTIAQVCVYPFTVQEGSKMMC